MLAIRENFLSVLVDRVALLEKGYASLATGAIAEDDLENIGFVAHKLHGTAATLGFAGLGERAIVVETFVNDAAKDDYLPAEFAPALADLIKEGRRILLDAKKTAAG